MLQRQLLIEAMGGLAAVKCKSLIVCTPAVQRGAVVLLMLTGQPDATLHWVRLRQRLE